MITYPALWRPLVGIVAGLCLCAPLAADSGWSGEAGVFVGSHDNFFFRGANSPAPSSDLLSASLTVERVQDTALGDWTFGLAATTVSVEDIDDADYETFQLTTEFKRGPWKAALSYEELLNRLFSESGESVFFDESAVEFWLRYSINRRLWVRLRAETADQDFGASQDDRDADAEKFALTLRMAATEHLAVRVSWLSEDRSARGPENNRTGSGFALALEASPREDLTWFLRYRSRDRDYEDAPIGENNFGRSDTVDDINFNVRWRFKDAIGLMVRDTYRSGDSTRPDRNFTGNVIEAGVFFQFGTGN